MDTFILLTFVSLFAGHRASSDAIWFPVDDEEGLIYLPKKHLYSYIHAHENTVDYGGDFYQKDKRRTARENEITFPDENPSQISEPSLDNQYINTPKYWQGRPVRNSRHMKSRRDIEIDQRYYYQNGRSPSVRPPFFNGARPNDGFGDGRRPWEPKYPVGDGFGNGRRPNLNTPPPLGYPFPTQTNDDLIRTTPAPDETTEDEIAACERRCQTTPEFNPVCTTSNVQFFNPGKLKCAQSCGRNLQINHWGTCPTTAAPDTITTTTSRSNQFVWQ